MRYGEWWRHNLSWQKKCIMSAAATKTTSRWSHTLSRAPAFCRAATTAALPSPSTDLPSNGAPAAAVKMPPSSNGDSTGRLYLSPTCRSPWDSGRQHGKDSGGR